MKKIKRYAALRINNKKSDKLDKISIVMSFVIFIALSYALRASAVSSRPVLAGPLTAEASTVRGVITQLQMLISVYLALKESPSGFFSALSLNIISIVSSFFFCDTKRFVRFTSGAYFLYRGHLHY
jgi:hypothetical protein